VGVEGHLGIRSCVRSLSVELEEGLIDVFRIVVGKKMRYLVGWWESIPGVSSLNVVTNEQHRKLGFGSSR